MKSNRSYKLIALGTAGCNTLRYIEEHTKVFDSQDFIFADSDNEALQKLNTKGAKIQIATFENAAPSEALAILPALNEKSGKNTEICLPGKPLPRQMR